MGGLQRGLQLFGKVKLLPRHGRIAKVAVGRGAAVYRAAEIERADYGLRPKVKAAAHGGKRNVCIKVTQPNGKETNVKVPFGVVKMGLRVGNVFGLQRDVADKIGALLDDPAAAADILSVDGENGEHVTISIE